MTRNKLRARLDAANNSGSVGTIFALSFIPMILIAGAAIDYSRSLTQWSNLQQATDATALAVAHTYLNEQSTPESLKPFAQTYINGLMTGATINTVTITNTNTVVCLSTASLVPTVLMRIANILSVPVATNACSQVGQTYEVALALDNSGSMFDPLGGQKKINALIDATKTLVDILNPKGTLAPQVAISLVPFTSSVNVGTNQNAPFLDLSGNSSIHWQNFHRPSGVWKPTTKLDLFTKMGVPWAGCVEEPPPPAMTHDTIPSSDPNALFVPYLAPDEPGDINDATNKNTCFPNGSTNCGRNGVPPYKFGNSYISDNGSSTSAGNCSSSNKYANADNLPVYPGDGQTNIEPGSGMSMVCKYNGGTVTSVQSDSGFPSGPNEMCAAAPLTPLTTDRDNVLFPAIKLMNASNGLNTGTAQSTGFMWAWRTLSPDVNPFPTTSTAAIGPQNPKAYDFAPPPNNKIKVLMSDGANAWTPYPGNPFGSVYQGYGYYANGRLNNYSNLSPSVPGSYACDGSQTTTGAIARCQLDNVLLEACSNAKRRKIKIFTVAFVPDTIDPYALTPNAATVLRNCASDNSHFFLASSSASLQAAFVAIANSIESLRLSQ